MKKQSENNEVISENRETGVSSEINIPEGLFFNILPFEFSGETVSFDFTTTNDREKQRFATRLLPETLQKQLLKNNGETSPFLYTDFKTTENGYTLNIDLATCQALAKAWYTSKIRDLLSPETVYHQSNFLNDTQFWCAGEKSGSAYWHSFHKFTLRVQFDFITSQPELIISYDGMSYIAYQSFDELSENDGLDTRMISTVAFRKKIYRYTDLPEEARYARGEQYPVINRELAAALNQDLPYSQVTDSFDVFYRQVSWFYQTYCSGTYFREVIPHKGQWKKTVSELNGRMDVSNRQLVFGQGNTHNDAYNGLKNYGPLKLPQANHFKYFFIFFEHQEEMAHKLYNYILKEEGFIRMDKFTRLPLLYDKNKNIVIRAEDSPETYIQECLQNRTFEPDVTYFAFYISPFTRFEPDEQKKALYYHVKEMLLYRQISMQAVEGHKLAGDFKFSMSNIGIALIAKLGGVPWRLEGMDSQELVIGFGAYRNKGFNMGYTGSAICFSQDGMFREFDVFPAENTRAIAGAAMEAFRQYRKGFPGARRMTIHFYKRMSRRELEPLEKMLTEMKLDIPVVVAGISKTPSKSLLLFDHPKSNTMPADGTWAKTGYSSYLLNINLRKQESSVKVKQTMPLRVTLQCNKIGYLAKTEVVLQLLEQIYAFSYMHWQSVKQSPLPVTVKYPSMIASFMPWFKNKHLPAHGRTKPWFL